jgi:hypothetical protein
MGKKVPPIDEKEMLARMAGIGNNNSQSQKNPIKEKGDDGGQPLYIVKENGNGKKNTYEEKYITRSIYGTYRGNVGISKDTLDIATKIIARIFDNRIAIGAFIDNILWEHFNKYKKDYELWLAEKPTAIF